MGQVWGPDRERGLGPQTRVTRPASVRDRAQLQVLVNFRVLALPGPVQWQQLRNTHLGALAPAGHRCQEARYGHFDANCYVWPQTQQAPR